MVVAGKICLVFGFMALSNGECKEKFCTKIDKKHTYKFCVENFLYVNDYKHGDGANL
jgi:hypothetical protein